MWTKLLWAWSEARTTRWTWMWQTLNRQVVMGLPELIYYVLPDQISMAWSPTSVAWSILTTILLPASKVSKTWFHFLQAIEDNWEAKKKLQQHSKAVLQVNEHMVLRPCHKPVCMVRAIHHIRFVQINSQDMVTSLFHKPVCKDRPMHHIRIV